MSCFDCIHSTPAGCALNRAEFETYAPCPAWEYESGIHTADALMAIFGFKRVENKDTANTEVSGAGTASA